MNKRKAWVTPELIVLVRRRPEEGVLVSCQNAGSGSDVGSELAACQTLAGKSCIGCES